jgi:hypothetical protein
MITRKAYDGLNRLTAIVNRVLKMIDENTWEPKMIATRKKDRLNWFLAVALACACYKWEIDASGGLPAGRLRFGNSECDDGGLSFGSCRGLSLCRLALGCWP